MAVFLKTHQLRTLFVQGGGHMASPRVRPGTTPLIYKTSVPRLALKKRTGKLPSSLDYSFFSISARAVIRFVKFSMVLRQPASFN